MNKQAAAARLGIAETELVDVFVEDAGVVYTTTDGQAYIDVPAVRPDADGKTGLMFLAAPTATYAGTFPVFATPIGDEPPEPEAPVAPVTSEPVPEGSIAAVLDWVGDDRDRALQALAAELAVDEPRKSLIHKLEVKVGEPARAQD